MNISAIIPVKNRPELVIRAIESCFAQTLPVMELRIVDDASDDETPLTLHRFAERDTRIKVITSSRGLGAAGARNLGAAGAHGDYLAFLDSDDIWDARKLESQAELANAFPGAPAIACGVVYRYPKRARIGQPPPEIHTMDLRASNVVGGTSVGLVCRAAFEKVGGFDVTLPNCEDWDLWLKLAAIGPLRAVQMPLVTYSFDADNKLSRQIDKLIAGHEMMFQRIVATTNDPMESKLLLSMHDLKRAENHLRITSRYTDAWRAIMRALARNWSSPAIRKRALHLAALAISSRTAGF